MLHPSIRRQLETPCKIPKGPEIGTLAALRPTCGVYDTGKRFVPLRLLEEVSQRPRLSAKALDRKDNVL